MKRFWIGGSLIVLLGCGGRTEYFDDSYGTGGGLPGRAGSPGVAGAPPIAGSPGAGASAGAGAAPSVGGSPSFAGGPHFGGAPGIGGSPSGGSASVAGAPSAGGSPGAAGSGASPGVVQVCQAIASNSCQKCLCSSCSSQIVQCVTNFGCALIIACAQQTGCQGVGCYTAQNCRKVIDQFGGLGSASMKDALSLLTCSVTSQNSCSCN